MVAFLLTVGLVLFWAIVGYALLSAIYLKPNLLQNALLAPVVGIAFTLLPIFVLNRMGLPIGQFGVALFLILVALSFVLLWRFRPPFPWRIALPFGLVLLLALVVISLPMFKYGFDWMGYSTDDYANYILHAHWLVNHGYFAVPAVDNTTSNYFDVFLWMLFPYGGSRMGAEMLLAWVMNITGLTGLQAYMPVILAYHVALISAAGALVCQSRRYRLAALFTCLLLSVSAMNTLGTLFQFLAQIPGIALVAAVVAVLFRPFAGIRHAVAIRLGLLVGGLMAALMITYPEVMPFLGVAYILYLVVGSIRRHWRWRLAWRPMLIAFSSAAVLVVVTVTIYMLDFLRYLLGQSTSGILRGMGSEYSFFLIPSGLANLWGLQTIPRFPSEPYQSLLIIVGACLLVLAVVFMVRLTWHQQHPVAILALAMFLAGLLLFTTRSPYGSFKLAIYIQPFLLGSLVVGWLAFTRRRRVAWQVGPLLVVGLLGIGAQFQYIQGSLGLAYGNGPVIAFASEESAFSELEQELNGTEGFAFRSDATAILAKLQSLFLDQRPTEFIPAQEYTGNVRFGTTDESRWFDVLPSDRFAELGTLSQFADLYELHMFDLHTGIGSTDVNGFYTERPQAVLDAEDPLVILTTPRQTTFNWARLNWFDGAFFAIRPLSEVANYLVFVQSSLGQHYSHAEFDSPERPELGNFTPSAFQPEPDYFFPQSPMFAMGRHLLFEVLNPSSTVRVRLDFTSSFRADGENQLPPSAAAIGTERLPLPITGRGSAQVYSPPLVPQEIDGHYYVALDMGDEGLRFPTPQQGLMTLFGTDVIIDPRRVVGHGRDISVISDDEYANLNPPASLDTFPADLANSDLEYSGIYEDGWLSEASFFCLGQPQANMQLVVHATIPLIDDPAFTLDLAVSMDGQEVAQENYSLGSMEIIVPSPNAGRHCIELRFSDWQRLPGGDNRPTSAQLNYIGFQ